MNSSFRKTDRESPIYVELKDRVAVRGHDQAQQTATELRLTRSRYDGKSLTMPMNRRFLKNALSFGINRIGFDPDERTPVVGYGNSKTFVVMPLEGDEPKVEANIRVAGTLHRIAGSRHSSRLAQAMGIGWTNVESGGTKYSRRFLHDGPDSY